MNQLVPLWEALGIDEVHYADYGLVLASQIVNDTMDCITENRLIQVWYCLLYSRCACLHTSDTVTVIKTMKFILKTNIIMHCDYILACIRYEIQEHKYPTSDEIDDYMSRSESIVHDMNQYCIDNEVATPVSNLTNLRAITSESNEFCCICQETIPIGSSIYQINCQHCFHAKCDQCLGENQSILTWFQNHNTCPVCNTVVTI